MALVVLAHDWARECGGHVTALTVDHGLRAESRAETEQVAAWMAARGIAHYILTPPHTPDSNNLQEAARGWRYDAIAAWCRAHGVLHCLLAHHAGDQRETVAHNLTRGDTADGASGMACARNYRGVRFLRPLLAVEKSDLEDYLRAQSAPWIEDPSNQNPRFARVRTRTALRIDEARRITLTHRAQEEGAARAERDLAHAHIAAALVTLHPAGYAEFFIGAWRALAPDSATQLLADLLTTVSGAIHRPRASDTGRLAQALHGEFQRRTLHGCEITQRDGIVCIARETARVAPPLALSGHGTFTWDNRFRVHYTLPASLTLTLRALGADGKKQLGRSLIPLATPSLWYLDTLLHVPHISPAPLRLPSDVHVTIGFAPAKPLAAAPFWWLNSNRI